MGQQVMQKLYVAEAIIFLLLARLALVCLPFKFIVCFFDCCPRQTEVNGDKRKQLINSVRRAVVRAARILPVQMVCFPRALAAYAMLRRRRVHTTLYYGAMTKPGRGLMSHVWVQDGHDGVIGFRAATGYKVIATYPK
jgi:hypothetical protein